MRTFILLFCTAMFGFSNINVFSQSAKITVNDNMTVTVDEVFKMLKKQTNYTFIYQEDLFKGAPMVNLERGEITANELLSKSLSNKDFELLYDNVSQTLVIRTRPLVNATIDQNTFLVEGTITDAKGMPIPGVTVIYKQYPVKGTAADFDGKYQILVNKNEEVTLQFSSVGFVTQEIVVNGRRTINVVMQEETTSLDEVVVVGYGTQKRSEVSSAISSVKSEKVVNNLGANTSFDRGLTGLIKGVQVTQGSGQPGSGVDINIRGITSPFAGADNNPLFVIDGVPFQTNPTFSFKGEESFNETPNPLNGINPNDIESIDVLKDASATAIYGSRGANGVIIVNTKKGRKGEKANVTFTSVSTFARPINTPDYLNTAQYKDRAAHILENSAAFANANSALSVFTVNGFAYMADVPVNFGVFPFTVSYNGLNDDWFGDADTNWVDEVYRDPAFTQQYNLSIRGGSEKSTYGFTLGHTDQEGLLKEDKFKQYNFRTNLETQISNAISTGFNVNLSYSDNQSGLRDANNALNSFVLPARPDIAPRDEFGNFNRLPAKLFGFFDSETASPLALATAHDNNTKSFSLLGNIFVEAELFKDFKVRSDINVGRFNIDGNDFLPNTLVGNITPAFGNLGGSENSTLDTFSTTNTNIIANLTADYQKTFAEKHNVTALLGFAWDRSYSERTRVFYQGFPDDNTLINVSSASEAIAKGASEIESGLNSIFSRVSYNYDQRYFLTLNFRTDKSAKFGPGNQRGYFPSVAASWDISNESFLENNDVINHLRLRAGYGSSGSNNIADFAYLQFWEIGFREEGLYNGNPAVGLSGILPNLDIKWENTDEVNIGLDFALFNNRLRGGLDVYNRKTTDALMGGFYPLESGANSYTQNFADLTNKGFELDLFGDVVRSENLTWSLGFNISKNKNTLDKFNASSLDPFVSRLYEVGREVNIITGYVTDGYFQTQDEIDNLNATAPDNVYQEVGTAPGDYKYVDLNGDGEITTEDQQYLGSAQPDFFGGFNTLVSYKGFDLSANFNFSVGGEGNLAADRAGLSSDPTANVETRYLDTWTPDNPNAAFPRAVLDGGGRLNNNSRMSSALVYNTSYLRLQSLQLRYNLPQSAISSLGLSNVSLSLTGTNLWTSTDFPGLDPAALGGFAGTASTGSTDPYPIAKTWSIGVNVNF